MRRRAMIIGLAIGAMVAVTAGNGRASTSPALSPSANTSMVLYKLAEDGTFGTLRTGTLVNGVFTRKDAFKTGRWSDIAIGRDTMAMYDRRSGRLITGTLKGGFFRQKASRRIAKGFTHVAASCDSVAFYRLATGATLTAELTSGQMRDPRTTNLGAFLQPMDATCDSLVLQDSFVSRSHILRDGHILPGDSLVTSPRVTHLAANRTTSLIYNRPDGGAYWFSVDAGDIGSASSDTLSTDLDIIAGVGDGMVFYNGTTGATYHWRLVDGVLTNIGPGPSYGKGLTLIAGGR